MVVVVRSWKMDRNSGVNAHIVVIVAVDKVVYKLGQRNAKKNC